MILVERVEQIVLVVTEESSDNNKQVVVKINKKKIQEKYFHNFQLME